VKRLLVVLAACGTTRQLPPQDPPPPWGVPISGGTMLVSRDGARAVIADPDRDRVLDVDLASGNVAEIALAAGDEPGRLVEDGAGRIHVALRRAAALVTIANDAVIDRRAACGDPRGVAWDSTADAIHVACADGQLVTFPAAGGAPTRVLRLDRDLRDVIVQGQTLLVTRFRSAELLAIDATGAVTSRTVPPTVTRNAPPCDACGAGSGSAAPIAAIPAVAWRAVALPDGRTLIAHQRQLQTTLMTTQGGYGGECGQGPVEDAYTVFGGGTTPVAVAPFAVGALPVDIAVDATGSQIAVVTAGTKHVTVAYNAALTFSDDGMCGDNGEHGTEMDDQLGAPTSVAFDPSGELLVYYPELPALVVHGGENPRTIVLPGPFGYDSGRNFFHTAASSTVLPVEGGPAPGGFVGDSADLACASCHPEAREDGLVWQFNGVGARRTQSIAGHILARAPYHWAGDEADLPTLMDDVFTVRMSGGAVSRSQHMSLGPWLDRVPTAAAPPAVDPAAVGRGSALFTTQGCAGCHGGPLMTTLALANVGTGGTFKVPSLLGIGARAPFMHDGCAATLTDRFGACGGTTHGNTAGLTAAQIADLVAYLDTL
jgi:mono/diheme cytochrome c family protein